MKVVYAGIGAHGEVVRLTDDSPRAFKRAHRKLQEFIRAVQAAHKATDKSKLRFPCKAGSE
jgi:ribosomal protein L44E